MKRFAAVAACVLLLAACRVEAEDPVSIGSGSIRIWHDDQRSVTCWVYKGYQLGGLSCIPDSQLSSNQSHSCPEGTRELKPEKGFLHGECAPSAEVPR